MLKQNFFHCCFQDALRVTKSNDNFTLDAANRLYVQDGYTILPEYMTKTSQHFEADAKNLDFGSEEKARKEINSWVEEKTRQKIKDLIPAGVLSALTRLVLVNAVYFKSDWAAKFDKKSTRKAKFQPLKGEQVEVDMMHRWGMVFLIEQ